MPQAPTYDRAVQSLYALGHELAKDAIAAPGQPRLKWELAHMRTLCAALGDPQHAFPSILIAGTNGKGSTAATLASILDAEAIAPPSIPRHILYASTSVSGLAVMRSPTTTSPASTSAWTTPRKRSSAMAHCRIRPASLK